MAVAGLLPLTLGPAIARAEDGPAPAVVEQQTRQSPETGVPQGEAANAEAPPAKPQDVAGKPQTQVDASKGGLTIRSGDNSVTFGVYTQVRGVLDDRELYDADAKDTLGSGREDGLTPAFDVVKVRVSLRGTMFRPWVKYNFAFEAGRTPGESSSKIKDAYLELGKDTLSVRAGQYKVPFGLQEQAPDTGQEFVDRSLANAAFAPSRDAGVMLTGAVREKRLGYALGVFNGSGESKVQNNRALMWAARLWLDPLGEYKLAESAVETPSKGSLHVGVAARGCDAMKGGTSGVVQDVNKQMAFALELAWKWRRLFLTAEGFWQRGEVRNPTAGPDVEGSGWHVQGGYMVLAKRLELDLRYAEVDPDRDVEADKSTELRAGANYYWKAHNLKLQADAGLLTYEAEASGRSKRLPEAAGERLQDFQLRLQLQLSF